MVDTPLRDLRRHLLDDLAEVEAGVEGHRGGRLSAYQTVAVQLRNMLTDTSRAGPLLGRVISDPTFHRLREPHAPIGAGPRVEVWSMDMRGSISIGGGPSVVTLAVTEELIPVDEWLDDWIVRADIRIRDLIHEVASKDGAHTDDDAGPTMLRLEGNQRLTNRGVPTEMARPVIVGIGAYVAGRVRELLANE